MEHDCPVSESSQNALCCWPVKDTLSSWALGYSRAEWKWRSKLRSVDSSTSSGLSDLVPLCHGKCGRLEHRLLDAQSQGRHSSIYVQRTGRCLFFSCKLLYLPPNPSLLLSATCIANLRFHFACERKDIITSKMLEAVRVWQVSVILCHLFRLHKNPIFPEVSGGQG